MGVSMRLTLFCGAASLALIASTAPAFAQGDDTAAPDDSAFGLGQITVTAPRPQGIEIGGETINSQAILTFDRNTLDEAVNLIPGVHAGNSGGSRNERLIFVRGFDRFQVPLSIDGIRVYLPADNRLDYGRFLTPDIAEVQVAKGYASVLDGPGGMGGAVNLVTRKPTKEIEAEVRGTLNLGRDVEYAGYNVFALLGTKHDKWYAQASFARSFTDHWDLPGGFRPFPTSEEDGGERDFSRTEDWRVNVKVGFTPNATDEYSLSYTRQEGSKNAPLYTGDPATNQVRYWSWPYWNIDSIYFLSSTAIGDNGTLKTRLYYNTFDNLLRGFDTRAQNSQTSSAGRVTNSWYDDNAYGGSIQFDANSNRNRFSLAVHYRRDKHVEWAQSFPSAFIEPPQRNIESTWSVAIEDRFQIDPTLTLVAGLSYDIRDTKIAEEYGMPPGGGANALFQYPIRNSNAWNAQGQLIWTPNDETNAHLSVSSRARFPTVFERYSSRFGGATSNPDLEAERATNVELGGSHRFGKIQVEGAVFYSHVDNVIVSYPFIYNNTSVTQSRNVGDGDYYGVELAVNGDLGPTLSFGANYTYIHRDLHNPSIGYYQLTDVPSHKGFVFVSWRPVQALTITPSLDFASDRTTVTPASSTGFAPNYYRTGAYALANLSLDYRLSRQLSIGIGAKNLFDESYQLTDGFPEPGRSFFATIRATY